MVLFGLFYLVPFILIYVLFARLGNLYDQKISFQIMIAIILYFIFRFTCTFTISYLILKYSSAENPKQIIVDNIFVINFSTFILATFVTFLYYRFIKNKMNVNLFNQSEIEDLGTK